MRWLLGLCLAVTVFSRVAAKPAALQEDHDQEVDLEAEIMNQLLNKLLIPSQREAREMMDAENDEDDMETADAKMEIDMAEATEEGDAKALGDSEALREAKQMEVARFNNYIDAIYRRMNAALKAKLMDPMELNLDEKVKKNSEDKKKAKKSRVLREAVEDDDVDDQEVDIEVDRMGKPSNKGGKKKKGKGKSKEERQAERQKKKNLRKKKEEKDKSAKEKRRALKKDKKEKKKKNAKKSNRESRSGQKNNKNDKKKKARKNNKGKNKARKQDTRDGKSEKMVGSLSGIATMERAGDVKVEDEDNHKVVSSEFSVGPLQLQVSKIYGKGKARTVRTAKAVTEVMSGTLVLKVKPDGTAHVKKVVFKKPENVEVKGKLSENNPRSLNSMRNSVNKMRPLAAMKILKTARYVLKSPTTKQ